MAKEGSRGGHIIGHTKSGAPIYGSPADHAAKVDAGKQHTPEKHAQAKSNQAAAPEAVPQESKPWSVTTDVVVGALIGNVPGAVAGYLIGTAKNDAYNAKKKANS